MDPEDESEYIFFDQRCNFRKFVKKKRKQFYIYLAVATEEAIDVHLARITIVVVHATIDLDHVPIRHVSLFFILPHNLI